MISWDVWLIFDRVQLAQKPEGTTLRDTMCLAERGYVATPFLGLNQPTWWAESTNVCTLWTNQNGDLKQPKCRALLHERCHFAINRCPNALRPITVFGLWICRGRRTCCPRHGGPGSSHNQFSNNHDWFKNLKNLLAKSQSLWACSFPVTKLDAHPRHRLYQWPIQVPKSEVPTIYKAYFLGLEGDIHLK